MARNLPAEIDARIEYPVWPDDKPFPLTPLEAWYVMQGYAVRPKTRPTVGRRQGWWMRIPIRNSTTSPS